VKSENGEKQGFHTIPLYQNGICFGQKLVPNGKWLNGGPSTVSDSSPELKMEGPDWEDDLPLNVNTHRHRHSLINEFLETEGAS